MSRLQYKRAVITVVVEGCRDCGTKYSTGWFVEETLPVTIGKTKTEITVSVCADCKLKAAKLAETEK